MRYKVGDRVKIKSWEQMERDFGLNSHGSIKSNRVVVRGAYETLQKLNCNRILTIKEVVVHSISDYYRMEEIVCDWTDDMIECLDNDYLEEVCQPIFSRYEILDLREI